MAPGVIAARRPKLLLQERDGAVYLRSATRLSRVEPRTQRGPLGLQNVVTWEPGGERTEDREDLLVIPDKGRAMTYVCGGRGRGKCVVVWVKGLCASGHAQPSPCRPQNSPNPLTRSPLTCKAEVGGQPIPSCAVVELGVSQHIGLRVVSSVPNARASEVLERPG